jgi:RHS repeat-associated protein
LFMPRHITLSAYRNSTSPVPIDAGHLVTSGITETNYTDCGNVYNRYYAVTAVNENGESAPSNEAQASESCGSAMAITLPVLNVTALTESGGDPVVTKYYFAGGKRVAMDREGVVQWLIGDHLGTTSLVLNADGTVHSEARHYPYGEERWSSGTLPTDYRFTGQRNDSYIKLTVMGARWYDGQLGRWISPDTIIPDPANPQSFNRYSYVLNRPLVLTDPSGHAPSDGCEHEGCLSDPDTWGWEFIVWLLENTDFSDPSDNPIGQIIIRNFDFVLPLGMEDGASINEIVTVVNKDSMSYVRQAMDGWYPIDDTSELLVVSAAFIVAAESGAEDISEGSGYGGLGAGRLGGTSHRAKVAEIAQDIEARGFRSQREFYVTTPGGHKKYRFVDVAALDLNGDPVEFHQVGRAAHTKGMPVARERRALSDIFELSGYDVPIHFHVYK